MELFPYWKKKVFMVTTRHFWGCAVPVFTEEVSILKFWLLPRKAVKINSLILKLYSTVWEMFGSGVYVCACYVVNVLRPQTYNVSQLTLTDVTQGERYNIKAWYRPAETTCLHIIVLCYVKLWNPAQRHFHSECQTSPIFIQLSTSTGKLPGGKEDDKFIVSDILRVPSLAVSTHINLKVLSCKLKTLQWFIHGCSESFAPFVLILVTQKTVIYLTASVSYTVRL